MKKPWSISTTVRNPERLRDFLKVLNYLEGEYFNKNNQIKYQVLLIQNRFYIPLNIPLEFKEYYNDLERHIPYEIAKEIFYRQKYKDPPMRGRQSVNPLNKLGFSIAREKIGPIKITELGKKFLEDDYDIGYIFFKSLLKLQFPNPWSEDFSNKEGFNIMPFIAVLHVIKGVNKLSNKRGLTKEEFCIFIPTFININELKKYIEKILEFRQIEKKEEKEKYIINFLKEFYNVSDLTETKINNLYDYGDNIMRYFRLTKYFKVTMDPLGFYWNIDLEPSRETEINQILEKYDGKATHFVGVTEYIKYLSDINEPHLPWEEESNLKKVVFSLRNQINSFVKKENIIETKEEKILLDKDISTLNRIELERYAAQLRNYDLILKERIKKKNLIGNIEKIKESIRVLNDKKTLKKYLPEQFEKLIVEILKIINDEKLIKANYPVDDNGEPINHAPANKSDIECFYQTFKAICEVTLNTTKLQWVQEGQPVMRHLRDFENRNKNVPVFCIFIAPKIHLDTYSQFWIATKYEYNGKPQNIIPFTTEQLSIILDSLLSLLTKGKQFNHRKLFLLYNDIINEVKKLNSFSEWSSSINKYLLEWQKRLVRNES